MLNFVFSKHIYNSKTRQHCFNYYSVGFPFKKIFLFFYFSCLFSQNFFICVRFSYSNPSKQNKQLHTPLGKQKKGLLAFMEPDRLCSATIQKRKRKKPDKEDDNRNIPLSNVFDQKQDVPIGAEPNIGKNNESPRILDTQKFEETHLRGPFWDNTITKSISESTWKPTLSKCVPRSIIPKTIEKFTANTWFKTKLFDENIYGDGDANNENLVPQLFEMSKGLAYNQSLMEKNASKILKGIKPKLVKSVSGKKYT